MTGVVRSIPMSCAGDDPLSLFQERPLYYFVRLIGYMWDNQKLSVVHDDQVCSSTIWVYSMMERRSV
jgi:hypothetical protein